MKVRLPLDLKKFEAAAKQALLTNPIKDIEFSGQTYQVLVEDHLESYWVFLQLDSTYTIRDGFCSCENSPLQEPCVHLATAYLSLFGHTSKPLHERFSQSLWNNLCRLYEDRLGSDIKLFTHHEQGHFQIHSSSGKKLFFIQGLNSEISEKIEEIFIFKSDKEETEETSLKFSNLSEEEINSWREGHPHAQLRYDLSLWSDLAKWLMEKQENHDPYKITFQYSKKKIPNWLQIDFNDTSIGFYISEANLPLIIESLNTVKSPLVVHHAENKGIQSITYDKHEHSLHVVAKAEKKVKVKESAKKEKIPLQGWFFIPNDGFYAEEAHELLSHPDIYWEDIPQVLTDHGRLIRSLLEKNSLQLDPTPLSYQLEFDKQWNLHVRSFLFEPGNLSKGESWFLHKWAYLEDQGFYAIEDQLFKKVHTIIPSHKVSDFVTQNRVWLNSQEGFQTHIRSVEFEVHYEVTRHDRLVFKKGIAKNKKGIISQDFGPWIFVKDAGFYSKIGCSFNHLINSKTSLDTSQIPLFIRLNRDELQLIPQFFSEQKLVKSSTLEVSLTEKQKIRVSPHYEIAPLFEGKKLRLFDDIAYIDGVGFYELPLELRLPEKFRHEIEIEKQDCLEFLTYEIEAIKKYIKIIDPRLVKCLSCDLKIDSIEKEIVKGRGWYRFSFFYQTEQGIIPLNEIIDSVKKNNSFGFFQAGLVDLLDKKFDWIRYLDKKRIDPSTNTICLNSLEFLRLNAFHPIELNTTAESTQTLFSQLTELQMTQDPDFNGLKSQLRNYQEKGARWLWFLYLEKLSGLLCDDMGLGKTHQTMALMASIYNFFKLHAEGIRCPFLIVCPTSVLYHWEEKLNEFLPHMKVYTFYGLERNLEHFLENGHILLTSYGILRNEREKLSKIGFEAAIFDEVQVAKNQYSLVYAALNQVNSQIKIGLTGTPIENHLRELKSLFDIVLPGYMPGEKEFRESFIKPIEKENNSHQQKLLNRLIKPFTLRRKKGDVLEDLPEKIEELAHCDLMPEQSQLYSEVLLHRRHHLIAELEDENKAIPLLHIFSLLSSLKQICDHPAVYLKKPELFHDYQSGKWELFKELIREARESKQKVVVFTQYLNMLDIIEMYLTEEKVEFSTLRGATRNRKEQLKKFQEDPNCEIFLGSLQAAGLGIDLTAASVVIHYDRWWNAAKENQATDRVHRIGQKRGVQVFKLVTKWTLEEKIDAMISKKGQLLEEIIGVDDHESLKTFNRSELIELLNDLDISKELASKVRPEVKDDQ